MSGRGEKFVMTSLDEVRFGEPPAPQLAPFAWDESKHPRGQPENAGEFGPGGGGAADDAEARLEYSRRRDAAGAAARAEKVAAARRAEYEVENKIHGKQVVVFDRPAGGAYGDPHRRAVEGAVLALVRERYPSDGEPTPIYRPAERHGQATEFIGGRPGSGEGVRSRGFVGGAGDAVTVGTADGRRLVNVRPSDPPDYARFKIHVGLGLRPPPALAGRWAPVLREEKAARKAAGNAPFADAGPDLSGLGDLLSLSRQEVLDALFDAALDSFDLALPDAAFYSPDQPRVPAGQAGGGEWLAAAAREVAAAHPFPPPAPPPPPGLGDPRLVAADPALAAAKAAHEARTAAHHRAAIAHLAHDLLAGEPPKPVPPPPGGAPERRKVTAAVRAVDAASEALADVTRLGPAFASRQAEVAASHPRGAEVLGAARAEAHRRYGTALRTAEEYVNGLAEGPQKDRARRALAAVSDAPFYSPDQPRVPAGQPGGGRWAGGVSPGTAAARDAAADAVRDFARGQGPPTAAEAEALAGHLAWLTVSQIHALKAEHGLKGSAPNKAALVAKLAERFRAARAAEYGLPETSRPGKVYNAAPSELHVDPSRFQYKLGTDPSGVTAELKSVRTWNPDFAGVVSVWKDPANGKTYVVNGHHRHELAARLGAPSLAVRYVNARTATEARAVGALVNIAEGRGTAVDAAKFMRDSGVGIGDMERHGVSVRGKVAEDAAALARLSDRAFGKLTLGTLDQGKALAVARHLPDHALQDQLFGLLDKREDEGKDLSLRTIEEMAREMAATPTHTRKEASLFGDIESEESLFVPRNELKGHVRAELSKEVNDFLAVASERRAGRVAGAGNVLDVERNRQIAEQAARVRNVFDTLVNRKGPISDAINDAAGKLAVARTKRDRDAVRAAAVDAVRDAVLREAGITRP